jgi:hypothetical protein
LTLSRKGTIAQKVGGGTDKQDNDILTTHCVCLISPGPNIEGVVNALCNTLECEPKTAKRIISHAPTGITTGSYGKTQQISNALVGVGANAKVIDCDDMVGIKVTSVGDSLYKVAGAIAKHSIRFDFIEDALFELPAYEYVIPEAAEIVMNELNELGAVASTISMAEFFAEQFIDGQKEISEATKRALADLLQRTELKNSVGLVQFIKSRMGVNLAQAVNDYAIDFYVKEPYEAVPALQQWLTEQGVMVSPITYQGYNAAPVANTVQPTAAPTTGAPNVAKFCYECGSPIVPGASFCPSCGTKLV